MKAALPTTAIEILMARQPLSAESQPLHAAEASVGIPSEESQLSARLVEVIGSESLASFSRKSGVHESTLRAYVKRGIRPGLDHLIAICRAGNISLDWLATGKGPVHQHAPGEAAGVTFEDPMRLQATIEAVEKGLRAIGRQLPPDKYAELVVAAYELMGAPSASSAKIIQFIKAAR